MQHKPFISNSLITNATAMAFTGGIIQFLIPTWWIFTVPVFLIGYLRKGTFKAGFLGLFLLWGGYAWQIDFSTDSILTEKVASIFQLPSPALLILITALVGGFLGGLASASGSALHELILDLKSTESSES